MSEGNGFKPIPGYEGIYSASESGEIRRDAGSPMCKIGRILKPRIQKSAWTTYHRVNLCRDGKNNTQRIHRLIMLTFVGPCPDGKVVCHKNGNSFDNRLENLKYDTQKENVRFNIWMQSQQEQTETVDDQVV